MERRFRKTNQSVAVQVRSLRKEIGREFGIAARTVGRILGPVALWTTRREERRLEAGKTYEPPTIIERRNWLEV